MIASILRTRTASAERTYAELPDGSAIRYALKWQAMGFMLLVCHVLLTKQSFLLFPVVLVMLGWIYAKAPLAGLLVYFQFLIYQNWVISLFAPGMTYNPTFVMLQGTNFAAIVLMAAIGLNRVFVPTWQRNPRVRLITVAILIALCFAAAYGVLGAARQGATSASVYFREFTGSPFAVLVGLDVGRVWGFRTIAHGFLVSVVPSIVIAIIENELPTEYYAWINASEFMNLKSAASPSNPVSYSPADIIDGLTSGFFNISNADPSSWKSYRFMSSSMHGISYAYILAVASLIAVALRRSWWLLFTLPLLAIAGVKGAVMLLGCCLVLWLIWLLTSSRQMVVVNGLILLVAYVAFGIRSGIANLDFHVLGFLGGVHGFISNPLGRGLGVGGNLSSTASSGFHWEGAGGFMATGADFALESAVGVLIYQMGLGALAIFAVFMVLLDPKSFGKRVLQRSGATRNMPLRQDMLFIAVATVMVNGVFQEEAYAPTAAALLALLCAVIIINGQRPAVKLTAHASMLTRRVAAA